MKKLLITKCLILLTFFSYSQTTQGTISFSGLVSYSKTEYESTDVALKQILFSPRAGYFLRDNLELGLNIVFSQTDEGGEYGSKVTSTSIGPAVRYYIYTTNENFAFVFQGSVLFGSSKTETELGGESKGKSLAIYLSPGFSYFFNDKWGLDFELKGIGYTNIDPNKDVDSDNITNFTFGVSSLTPSLGFRYFISR